MKITFLGHGLVWDNSHEKVLCEFVNGRYKTDNLIEIERLKNYPTHPPGEVAKYYAHLSKKKE